MSSAESGLVSYASMGTRREMRGDGVREGPEVAGEVAGGRRQRLPGAE